MRHARRDASQAGQRSSSACLARALTAVVAGWTKCAPWGTSVMMKPRLTGVVGLLLGALSIFGALQSCSSSTGAGGTGGAPAATGGTTSGAGGSRGGSPGTGGAATGGAAPASGGTGGGAPATGGNAGASAAGAAGTRATGGASGGAGNQAAGGRGGGAAGNGGNPGSAGSSGDDVTAHLDDLKRRSSGPVWHLAPLRDPHLHGVLGGGEPPHRRLQPRRTLNPQQWARRRSRRARSSAC